MGKKKSVVLIVLITLILAALLFLCFAPAFPLSEIGSFNALINKVDLGSDLSSGYYTVYYPEGVISKEEYETLQAAYEYAKDEAEESGEAIPSDIENPEENYAAYKGIYLSNDIYEDGVVSKTFNSEFNKALRAVERRFEAKGYSDYTIRVQDDYTIRVEVPETDESPDTLFTAFGYSGGLIFSDSDKNVANKNVLMDGTSEYVKKAGVSNAGSSGYAVTIEFTKAGKAKFAEITGSLASSSTDGSGATLYIYIGDEQLMGATVSEELNQSTVYITGNYTKASAETVAAVINSVLDEDDIFDLSFEYPEYYEFAPTMGDYTALALGIALAVLAVASIIFALVKFKGMGLAHTYGFLTYLLALVLCVTLIPGIEITAGCILAVTLASAIFIGSNFHAFDCIKKEFATGKTLTASVKAGYKKCLAATLDVHIILFLISLAMYLISTGVVVFIGLVLMLAIAISAICSVALTRFYLYMFLAQPKNKIAFVGFRREETEDE